MQLMLGVLKKKLKQFAPSDYCITDFKGQES